MGRGESGESRAHEVLQPKKKQILKHRKKIGKFTRPLESCLGHG